MRSTLTLDDNPAESLNRNARLTGRSFKAVVNEAIRRGLARGDQPLGDGRERFVVEPQAFGLMPGIDPLRLHQLVDELELGGFRACTTAMEKGIDHSRPESVGLRIQLGCTVPSPRPALVGGLRGWIAACGDPPGRWRLAT